MPVERPTFHESWYRVADLHPRLRSTVQISRQHFRDQIWHVVQDHTNNAFFRLSQPAYFFLGLLDGKRTVGEAWKTANEQLGDDSPTQGEVIQLLGQLYTSNLLQAEMASDSEGLFKRYRNRVGREVKGYLMNLLFARIPLVDPDLFLDRWLKVLGWIFSPIGFVVWMILIAAGLHQLAGHTTELTNQASGVLSPDNLVLLYLAFGFDKLCHEFGHAISCKKFGRSSGVGGEVHVVGLMFLIFTPVPYVDASSSWALKSKWQRAMVGFAGIWVELALASIAAIIWANTNGGTLHALAYNVMFIASVSTLLFNANPLLRYDGYYILSDLLEIPNLAQRSKEYFQYLVKHHVWKVKQAQNPAHSAGESAWMFVYAIASAIMRVVVSVSILLFVAEKLFVIGALLAIGGMVTWVVVPSVKFVHYLITSQELTRVRQRAILTSMAGIGTLLIVAGLIPLPDRSRVQGIVEPVRMMEIHAGTSGFVRKIRPSGQLVAAASDILVEGENKEMEAYRLQLLADRRRFEVAERKAKAEGDHATAMAHKRAVVAIDEQVVIIDRQLADLMVKTPIAGTWVAPELEDHRNMYLRQGEKLGLVADLSDLLIRATAPQEIAGPISEELKAGQLRGVSIRVQGRPDLEVEGQLANMQVWPAAQERLPSEALGFNAGGEIQTAPDDQHGAKAAEPFFEIRIKPAVLAQLKPGQRVVVRFDFSRKPALVQGWTALLQLIQKRFHA